MNKIEVIAQYGLNKTQVEKIDYFITSLISYNKHTNLVGKSTLGNFWDRHVLDCLQLTKNINNKKMQIVDLGTGAGLPGILLSIAGYQKVLMIDSVKKKTDFVKKIISELSLTSKILNKRIEKKPITKHDIVVSRALAPLKTLLTYARLYSNTNTTSLFLKGRSVNSEINIAMKTFSFDYQKIDSLSVGDGCVLKIRNIKIKNV